jgi:PAS domain S-box-containing protein
MYQNKYPKLLIQYTYFLSVGIKEHGVHGMVIKSPDSISLGTTWNILIIDDDEEDFMIVREMLKNARGRKFIVRWASSFAAGRDELAANHYHAVLVDYDLGMHSGIELMREANARGYAAPLILFTGRGSFEVDIEAMGAGATLYLTKGEVNPLLLERAIRYAVEIKQRENELRVARETAERELAERKQAETALTASEAKFTRVFRSSPIAIAISTVAEGRFLEVNDSYTNLLGFSREELIGHTSIELGMFPDPRERQEIARLFREGGGFRDYEIRLLTKSGEPRDLLFSTETVDIDGQACMLSLVVDFTERKRAEKALRLTQASVDGADEMIAWFTPDGGVHYVNDATCRTLGYSRAELLDMTALDLSPGFTWKQYQEHWEEVRRRKSFMLEVTHCRKDGSEYPAEVLVNHVVHGGREYIFAYGRDITERKRTEQAMALANEQLQVQAEELEVQAEELQAQTEELLEANQKLVYQASLIDNISEAAISTDDNHMILNWNQAAERMYGWRAVEVLGKAASLYLLTEYLDETSTADVVRQLQERGFWQGEVTQTRKDGTRIFVAASLVNLKDNTGKTIGVIAVNRDITGRRRAEQSLRESQERLERAQQIAHLGSWELDLDQNRLTWSDEVYRIFGLQPQEFEATYEAFLDHVHPADRAAVDSAYSGSLRENLDSYEIEHRVVRKATGEIRFVHEKCEHFRDAAGRLIRSVGMVHDITERKQAEAALAETVKKLERSNQELEQFAFVASHDLQEPLRKIKMFGNSIQQQLNGKLDAGIQDYLDRMINASERMQEMIDDLLHLSRVSTQGNPFVPVDLMQTMAEVVWDLEPRILSTGGRVLCEPLPTIEADALQMRLVFQNLIGNALKFHKSGVPPLVSVSSQTSQSPTNHLQMVSILIEDNGIGFDIQQLETIVQPFQRLHKRDVYEGTGMGLAIVKKIVDRHGGELQARSTPGVGSTFMISLPARHTD